MDYNEIIKTLQDMESRFADGFSNLDRAFLDKVYYEIFGRQITNRGCSDCYRDAYIEIISKLKKDKTMPKKPDYKLKAGAVITFFGESKAYTSANLTNEVAEKYLALNADNANLFAELPDDWKARVAAFVERTSDGATNAPRMTEEEALDIIKSKDKEIADRDALIAEKDALLAEREASISDLEAQLNAPADAADNPTEKDLEIENLRMELGTANEQLAAAIEQRDAFQKEIENLKKENKGLKQSNSKLKKKAESEAATEDKA